MERIYSAHKTQRNLSTLDKTKSFNASKLLQVFLETGKVQWCREVWWVVIWIRT